MTEDFLNEISAINSIYASDTIIREEASTSSQASQGQEHVHYVLRLPSRTVSLRLSFPETYPDQSPSISGIASLGSQVRKGSGTHMLDLAAQILNNVYVSGNVCLFDLIEDLDVQLQNETDATTCDGDLALQCDDFNAIECSTMAFKDTKAGYDENSARKIIKDDGGQSLNSFIPAWYLSEATTEKKSTFLARACSVTIQSAVQAALAHLLRNDKKVAKATHNITAYRIRDSQNPAVVYQDCCDDGESAAGGRLLHLLQIIDAWNVFVVVSRWYGGTRLGPDRFRLINQVAREAVFAGGFAISNQK